jgi:hypothetical protein
MMRWRLLLLQLLAVGTASLTRATLVLPSVPPRGFNSFDLQMYSGEWGWNETAYRETAEAMVAQGLVEKGYDTIVLDGGWSVGALDEWGRSIPPTQRWPSAVGANGTNLGLKPLAKWTHDLGLKIGVWRIRGAPAAAVAAKLPVKGTNSTIDQLTWDPQHCPAGEERWCNCTWDHSHIGLDPAHPDSAKYYDSLVDLYASWDLDLLKWDCLYDALGGYGAEERLVVDAVRRSPRAFQLSLSPGGGMKDADASWVAAGQRATFYRVTNDFHASEPGALAEHAFVAGNISARFAGLNNTWPDLDLMDLGEDSPFHGTPAAKLHAAIWMMSRSALMFAGKLPADAATLNLFANPLALDIHASSSDLRVSYQGDCACTPDPDQSQHACVPINAAGSAPCVAVWWATMPRKSCRALALLNIGNTTATAVTVTLPGSGVGSNVTNIFGGASSVADAGGSLEIPVAAQGAELFMISDGAAEACATAPPHPSAPPPLPPTPWQLVWSDEFDGPAGAAPNASHWSVAGAPHDGVDPTHGPVEQQLYVPEAVALDGVGHVVIETKRQRIHYPGGSNPPRWYNFTSGWLQSKGKVNATYGKWAVRARLPDPAARCFIS